MTNNDEADANCCSFGSGDGGKLFKTFLKKDEAAVVVENFLIVPPGHAHAPSMEH